MALEELTVKQAKVLRFIERRLEQGDPPSQREIADHFGLAQNAAYQLLGYLRRKGYLVETGGHRGLRLSDEYLQQCRHAGGLPVVGRVAAGTGILAQENIEEYIDPQDLFDRREGAFFLRVVGDSMIDEGIMEGDFVVVQPADEVANGDIAVVMIDDEATVKRVYLQGDRIKLKPANRAAGYKTRTLRISDGVSIAGKVTGCFRRM